MSKNNDGSLSAESILSETLNIISYLSTSEEEKIEDERWHKQREKDEAEARMDAIEKTKGSELPENYPMPPKLPYPVPPNWDCRKAKREEERRAEDKRRAESEKRSSRDGGSVASDGGK